MSIMRFLIITFSLCAAWAQVPEANYDESKVGAYTLPDPLIFESGQRVKDAREWSARRRPELLRVFEEQVYGRTMPPHAKPVAELVEVDRKALGGLAVRKQATIWLAGRKDGPKLEVLLYLPAGVTKPTPVFVGLNFSGNHAVHKDPAIRLNEVWARDPNDKTRFEKRRASEATRGAGARQWQVEKILARGYGLATAYYQDIEPDFVGGMRHGVRPLSFGAGQTDPAPGEWGAIGAWAWGLSRIVDWLEADKAVDARRIAVMGHSRLGKTSLWAGALDTRFALVISNNSGEGGAALARRNYGETIARINSAFPHWFSANFKRYGVDPGGLPVDMHELLALIAPRPVYVASAEEDRWADPRGEFLAAVAAGPVYELLGRQGLGSDRMPAVHQPIMKTIGYHIRAGKHDVTEYDWEQYLTFADLHFKR
jgi:hypothetical protein